MDEQAPVPTPRVINKKFPSLKKRVKDALKGTGGARGGKKVNKDGLNAKQELFCQLYASDKEFFGNGTQSYIEAYDIEVGHGKGKTSIETCRFRAHELLLAPNVLKRIDEIMENAVLNDQFVDKQLGFVIAQHAEFPSKVAAIKEYNALKKRIKTVVEHRFAGVENMTDEELAAEEKRLAEFFQKKPAKAKAKK